MYIYTYQTNEYKALLDTGVLNNLVIQIYGRILHLKYIFILCRKS